MFFISNRLHEPHCSCIHTIECTCLRCGDIAIVFFRVAWLNTDSNDGVLIENIAQCLAEHLLILRGINDEGDRPDWHQSFYCQLNEGTADSHHINELLWEVGVRHGSKAATYATCHDDYLYISTMH